jgi:eukaryotic-like serine/threonine-protein kinase
MPKNALEDSPKTRAAGLRAGDTIDHYEIDSLVARSGMASIFRAKDLRSGETVAIKVPHPEMEEDEVFLARFEREEEIGSELEHPGVMKVYRDAERTLRYMVMEWVEGRELRKLLKDHKKLPAARAIAITTALCEALDYAHSMGVVHRDLKPENVMVSEGDRTKLIDFGIAGKHGARRLTFGYLSQIMGTPDYIAPEQVNGRAGDARSDIFAVGVMLYEMVTGATPFRGANPLLVMNDRLLNNPIPPRELNPEISPELQEVIYRALRRDPVERYRTAAAFAWDLEHLSEVFAEDRPELRDWDWRKRPVMKSILIYAGLALIPVVIFALLLRVANA